MAYTREEAEFRFKESWRKMQEKGLPEAFDINHLIEEVIYKAFLWAEIEYNRKPTISECVAHIKQYAKEMNGEATIIIKFE